MPSSNEFQALLKKYRQRVDVALDKILPDNHSRQHNLVEAIRYSVISGGGKRIRPVMVYAAGETVGADLDALDIPACAVEMIHAYSLIHDDLPAMDNDDLRRGQPTCHRAFDEATAILAGDALQALAFEIMAGRNKRHTDTARPFEMLKLLAEASGFNGMAGGQAIDLASVGRRLTLEQLEAMHRLKTGALIRASILLGAMCAPDTDSVTLDILARYADCIGLSFQIQDDILDVVGDTETLGKARGSDQKLKKPTYPAILGLDASRKLALEQHELALRYLEPLGPRADTLRKLSAYIVVREF